ncbi:hypothetical protein NHX12_028699 [Muraenolepis orangiensis]|uniref:Uncharacterized protein n=1 Tax=Muraenolepis orangiensis TaxID=630683 RepID=A0A9Q0IMZ2_9TELE|nr:hypothetical protein NHX12_028699 [Muraenolepis orangiensis]
MGGSVSQHRKSFRRSQRKRGSISDSEGNFGTPEAESPGILKQLTQHNNSGVEAHLNNLSSPPPLGSGTSTMDHNLNLTQSPGRGALSQTSATTPRPPTLSLPSPHTRPDPSEVDDQAPAASDSSSPDSNARLASSSASDLEDPDFINGNLLRPGARATFDQEGKHRSAQKSSAVIA